MGRREHDFSPQVKRDVRESQGFRCAYCQGLCRGHGYGEPNLEIHHVTPIAFGGRSDRENAIGLCDHTGANCHHRFDKLYFKEERTVFEVLMEEGRWSDLSRHPGNPYNRPRK